MGMCKPSGGKLDVIGHIGDLDPTGIPNTRVDLYNPDGKLIQQCLYGPDGRALWDRDWDHGSNEVFPHDHWWGWEINKEHPPRPHYKGSKGELTNLDYC